MKCNSLSQRIEILTALSAKINPDNFEDQWDSGFFVGFDVQSTEGLIATPVRVFSVTDIRRRFLNELWSTDQVAGMARSPKHLVPGQLYRRTPVFARKFSSERRGDEQFVALPQLELPPFRN